MSDVFEIIGGGMARRSRPGCPEDAEQEPRLTRFRIQSEELAVLSFPIAQASTVAHLTGAEREVAQAILHGLSNEEIAQRRGTSPRTVANQIAGLFRKMGAQSRSELARRLLDRSAN